MCQDNDTTESRKGKHLTLDERKLIEHLYNIQDKTFKEIGEELGRHRTTISREIKKGTVELLNTDYSTREEYVAERGQEVYDNNATAKGPKIKIAKEHELSEFIEEQIEEKYAPEVIANMIEEAEEFKITLHWKTIYNYIDKGILLVDREDLTYGSYDTGGVTQKREKPSTKERKEGRTISDRPQAADDRELGHWEMDLLEGQKGKGEPFLLVLTERCSRQEIIEKIKAKTQKEVIKGLDRIERRQGVKQFRRRFKSITTDNGREFYDYEGVETSFTGSSIPRTEHYYADAYCSWQRGSNENINKMIRRFIPKGESIKKYSKKAVKKIQRWVNDYPRKMFEFKSANDIYEEELQKV